MLCFPIIHWLSAVVHKNSHGYLCREETTSAGHS